MEVVNIKNIGFPVEDELYTRLKIVCLMKNVTLKEFLTKLIKEEVEKQEEELQQNKKE